MSKPNTRIARRTLLQAGIGAGVTLAMPRISRAAPMLARLALYGPPAGPSIPLAYAVATGAFAHLADEVSFIPWKDPDELRAGLTSGTMQLVILPTQVAANLYNRGLGVGLVNVMTDGLSFVVSADPAVTSVADLAGHRMALPFRNDMPDFLMRRLFADAGVAEGAVDIVPAATPIEAVQLLLTGRADAAVLPEPATTMAEMMALQSGKRVYRAIDMQLEWGKITGLGRSVPQAGLGMTDAFRAAYPDALVEIQAAIAGVLPGVLANPVAAAAAAAGPLGMPAPILAKSLPHCALVATPASAARPALEAMFSEVAMHDPRIIGGHLPDDGFYLL
ncbi:ABC transporter substrate-binding protein [Phaeovulum sp.]|uniref:ABC transporter substrate-binding protein n=1 Tax=Phaeovulum sp. TaxID=2934796 RepID=UPI0039E679B0